jgi:TRAP transporter TAXI family solute receptor
VYAGLFAALLTAACSPTREADPFRLRILTGNEGGLFDALGDALAEIYNARLPNVIASVVNTAASYSNVQGVNDGVGELALTQADVAFSVGRQGIAADPNPYPRVRAIAVLFQNALHTVVRRSSDIRTVPDLVGRRVGGGAPDASSALAARIIARAYGLEGQLKPAPLDLEETVAGMQRGELDAGFVVSRYPRQLLVDLNRAVGLGFLPIEPAILSKVLGEYPFLHAVTIPAGTYEGQTEDIRTLGVDILLVCRDDLPDDLIQELTRLLIESIPVLAGLDPIVKIDPDQAAAGAPIPVHPGAIRYFRHRELFR